MAASAIAAWRIAVVMPSRRQLVVVVAGPAYQFLELTAVEEDASTGSTDVDHDALPAHFVHGFGFTTRTLHLVDPFCAQAALGCFRRETQSETPIELPKMAAMMSSDTSAGILMKSTSAIFRPTKMSTAASPVFR